MTLAIPGRTGSGLVSIFSSESDDLCPARRETFAFSLLGQAAVLAIIVLSAGIAVHHPPVTIS
jgi:hypothetical protein